MADTAGRYDFTIMGGATFARVATWRDAIDDPIDLTGYSAKLQVRRSAESPVVLLELTDDLNDGLALGGPAGTITITRTAAQTAALTFDQGVYDLELTAADGTVTRLLEGVVTVSPEVTR